jgi:hypothetical protein
VANFTERKIWSDSILRPIALALLFVGLALLSILLFAAAT